MYGCIKPIARRPVKGIGDHFDQGSPRRRRIGAIASLHARASTTR
jgi:hypothetical protein